MRHLPLEILLLIAANRTRAQRGVFHRDASPPCVGNVEALNVHGASPWVVYNQLQEPCLQAVGGLPAPVCKCNLPVYNIYMANAVCQQKQVESWAEWAQSNLCNVSSPPPTVPYNVDAINMPKWAYTSLSNGQFDLSSALKKARGWSPIQIATPIIVGVGVALIAAILFFLYRRRRGGSTVGRRPRKKAWESAHLHAPRRFFGLIPERFTVRSRTRREPQWEIDENVVLDAELGRVHVGSPRSKHSRITSTTSLLSAGESQGSGRRRSFFDALAAKFSGMSLQKKYQSGTTKGPDYKRVHVVSRDIDARFALDGGELTPVAADAPPPQRGTPERQSTLPSVLDIRAPSLADSRTRPRREDTLQTEDSLDAPRTVFQSDYSLGTTDLLTPVSGSVADVHDGSVNPHLVHPRSPLIQAAHFNAPSPARDRSMYIERRESTDSLAHELYPRGPSYEY